MWNKNTKIRFYLAYETADSSVFADVWSERTKTLAKSKKICTKYVELEARLLDDVLSDVKFDKLDFLKIDAEGTEPEVLEGAKRTLETVPNVAVDCSCERHGKSTLRAVQNILEKANFNVAHRGYEVFGWK